jgi:hypothetical protein
MRVGRRDGPRGPPGGGDGPQAALRDGVGQRSDAFIRATGRALAGAFDRQVCTNWTSRARTDPKAVPGLLRDGLVEGGVPEKDILCIPAEEDALRHVLREAAPGDLVVIVSYDTDEAVALIDSLSPVAA